jgi:Flp pilus assembly pilin Flp
MARQLHFAGHPRFSDCQEKTMTQLLRRFWTDESAEDIAEYAVMTAVMLTITLLTVRLIGINSNGVFSAIASKIS